MSRQRAVLAVCRGPARCRSRVVTIVGLAGGGGRRPSCSSGNSAVRRARAATPKCRALSGEARGWGGRWRSGGAGAARRCGMSGWMHPRRRWRPSRSARTTGQSRNGIRRRCPTRQTWASRTRPKSGVRPAARLTRTCDRRDGRRMDRRRCGITSAGPAATTSRVRRRRGGKRRPGAKACRGADAASIRRGGVAQAEACGSARGSTRGGGGSEMK